MGAKTSGKRVSVSQCLPETVTVCSNPEAWECQRAAGVGVSGKVALEAGCMPRGSGGFCAAMVGTRRLAAAWGYWDAGVVFDEWKTKCGMKNEGS